MTVRPAATPAPRPAATSTRADHVVLGAGAVGRALVDALVARGVEPHRIRLVSRSGPAAPAGVQTATGDAADAGFAAAVAAGARVVYQVLGPAYHRWAQEFPALQDAAIAAAEATGARLVTLENVYPYGVPQRDTAGHVLPFTEDSPVRAHTRKGAVRARMHADLMAAHAAGRVEVAVGRASNYFGPGSGMNAFNLGDQAMLAALTGGAVRVMGDPDQPHTYSFIPDIAAGLALLGEHPEAAGAVWHLPNDPATRTTRQLLEAAFRITGKGTPRLRPTPPALLRVVGIVNPPAREVVEMLYEFDQPFVVDSSRIVERLGAAATPLDDALARTLDAHR